LLDILITEVDGTHPPQFVRQTNTFALTDFQTFTDWLGPRGAHPCLSAAYTGVKTGATSLVSLLLTKFLLVPTFSISPSIRNSFQQLD